MLMHRTMTIGVVVFSCASAALAGSLTPPSGPVAPTPGPEPRIAINRTNTPGDLDSIYRISAPGSYYLDANLTGFSGEHGIEITASNVTVDLMGFEVRGVAGSLSGVATTVAGLSGIEVKNGSVTGWGLNGVDMLSFDTDQARVESIRAIGNGAEGIRVASASIVESCITEGNGSIGILTGSGATVRGCTARSNTVVGIVLGAGCTIQHSSAISNGSGFELGPASIAEHCIAQDNSGTGFYVGKSCVVRVCTAHSNDGVGIFGLDGVRITGCNSSENVSNGIQVFADSFISGNTCDSNGFGAGNGAGIHVTNTDNHIEGNHCTDNDRGIDVDLQGSIIVRNTCSGNTTDWDIVANNVYGPIIDRRAPASASVSGFSAASSLGSTDPNANYSY